MRSAAQIVIPVLVPRGALLWVLVRLLFGALPLAGGAGFGSIQPSSVAIILLCGVIGAIDIRVRGERVLWANLGVPPGALAATYAAPAVPAEILIAMLLR